MVEANALVLGDRSYGVPFDLLGFDVRYVDTDTVIPTKKELEWADVVCFTGGADISPQLYLEDNQHAYVDLQRDLIEVGVYLWCLGRIPMVGICRGSQFLRGMSGGSLWQDIPNHGISGQHVAAFATFVTEIESGDPALPITVTSTHHQAAVADPEEHNFLDLLEGENKGTTAVEAWVHVDHEIAAVQYHPEYMDSESDGMVFFQDLVRHVLHMDPARYELEL